MLDLNNDIRLEFLNSNIVIEDMDIDVEITMTSERTSNEAEVKIWNLSEETKDIIRKNSTGIRILYKQELDSGYIPVFEGNKKNRIKTQKIKKQPSRKKDGTFGKTRKSTKSNTPQTQRQIDYETDGADEALIVELGDNYLKYSTTHFNKTYKTAVSTKTIIADIANSFNVGVAYLDNVNHLSYSNGIIKRGEARDILSSVCDRIGCNWTFQGDLLVISNIKAKYNGKTIVYNFDGDNCEKPEFEDNDEVTFKTILTPSLRPSDWCNLNFKNINGLFRVCRVTHKLSNYSEANESEITIKEV